MKTNEQVACNNWEKIGTLKERDRVLNLVNSSFSDMEALLRHRFEGEDKFEEILDEIFYYKDELIKQIKGEENERRKL